MAEAVETPEVETSQVTGGPPAETPAPQPVVPPSWNFREAAKTLGLVGDFADDSEAFEEFKGRLTDTIQAQTQQIAELERYKAHYLAQQSQTAQAPAQSQTRQGASSNDWWGAPQWSDADLDGFAIDPKTGQIARDAYGNPVVKPGYDPNLAHRYNAYLRFKQQKADQLLTNPLEALRGGLEPFVEEIVQKAVKDAIGLYGATETARRYVDSKKDLFLERDAQGNPIIGPNGQPVFSVAGRVFAQAADQAAKLGLDPDGQRVFAEQALELHNLRQQVKAKTPSPAPQSSDPSDSTDDAPEAVPVRPGANRLPRVSGAQPTKGSKPNLKDMLWAELRRSGLAGVN